jgi:tetratricopeptide (TPR) repeat protein
MKEIDDWADRLFRETPLDQAIDLLGEKLRQGSSNDRYFLAGRLAEFLTLAARNNEALQILDETIEQNPDDVRFAIRKASLYLYSINDPKKALRSIDFALERARRTKRFRREALGVKARILLKLGLSEELSRVLDEIMSTEIIEGVADVGRERDFVDRAPPGMIPENVLARYNEFRPKRPGDNASDEPPEWEPPEWE